MTRNEEVKIKLEKIRTLLKQKDLKAILLKKQPNFFWLTAGGSDFVSIATETGVVSILVTEKEQFIIANKIEYPRIRDEEVKDLDFNFLTYEWFEDRELDLVKKIVGEKKVGCDVYIPDFILLDGEVKKLRFELTEGEIDRYKYLGENLSLVVEETLFKVKKGMSEIEIAGMIAQQLWKLNIQPTAFMIASDNRIGDYRHPIATEKRVEKKVMASVNARYKGLITTITRMAYIGKIPEELKNQYKENVEIECIMIAKTNIGEKLNIPVKAAIEEYEKRGYKGEWKLHHQGGTMGYYPREIRVTPDTDGVVIKNQAFCWNPTISGTKSEDGFIVTENQKIMITKPMIFPKLSLKIEGEQFIRPDIAEI